MPYQTINLAKTLFIDIETVPEQADYAELDPVWQEYWLDKWKKTRVTRYKHVFDGVLPEVPTAQGLAHEAEQAYKEAGLYAEFGKVCCITVGTFKDYHERAGQRHFELISFYGTDEASLLSTLAKGLKGKSEMTTAGRGTRFAWTIAGHNIKEFDIPYICRRLLVHGLDFPSMLDIAGLKPWEILHLADTMEMWKFGDYKNFTPLALLAHRFGIPSPKGDMEGSQVYDAYQKGMLDDIATYCAKDVLTLAQLLLRWRGEELLHETEVETVLKRL
jgi:hypothetical protein